ncbi:DUF4401 domain-containing protein [Sphingosinicella sp. BN140058]|uniref:DUF4401 domain-containing protein n=1 Tax=Sphingosinicella sp. BN140058 TaxID=1892855 RepID=UPI0010108BAB|nr:DUF4401 domain-containing protein [Sphingosinicella sp. BN140058]QAY77803.1 DUF4401 domain-containing protein [Sphingosinicella sp. BN140058]
MSAAELWERLQAEHLVEGARPVAEARAAPWFVRVMLGIAGWLGAIFLLLFVGVTFDQVFRDGSVALIAGGACCAGAFGLFRRFDDNDFAEQFALAASLAGQMLIVVGLAAILSPDMASLFLAVAGAEAALALAVPNFLHRVLAGSGAAIALSLAINQYGLHGLSAPLLGAGLVWIWLAPQRWAADGRLWRPLGYGLVLALLLIETFRLFGAEDLFGLARESVRWIELQGPLIGRGAVAALLVWIALAESGRQALPPARRLAAGGAALLFGLLALAAPGLGSAMLILLLGFAAGNRILLTLGTLALLGFVAHFYYSLHLTLLGKSGMLAATGLCLLAAHAVLVRGWFSSPAMGEANG